MSLDLGHKLAIQKSTEKYQIESKEIILNSFNWTITKLGHKLMVSHNLRSYVIDTSEYFEYTKSVFEPQALNPIKPIELNVYIWGLYLINIKL